MRYTRLFCAIACSFAVAGCAETKDTHQRDTLYFVELQDCVYSDPSAEFDTLSYAMGMHYALATQVLLLDGDFDRELLVNTFMETLDADKLNIEQMYSAVVKVDEFGKLRYTPYQEQMRRNAFQLYLDPNAEVEDAQLFNYEFTSEEMSENIGRKMASELRAMQLPLNKHWMQVAFDDAVVIGEAAQIDSIMQLPIAKMMSCVNSKELRQAVENTSAAMSSEWINRVSKQADVVPYSKEGAETVYYRIDKKGNDRHPSSQKDSIYIEYALYSCYGMPIESTKSMLETIDKYASYTDNIPNMDEATRSQLKADIEQQREITASGGATMGSLFFEVLGDCLKEIGEGGSITVWMPASHISNVALGSQNLVYTNMGGVITIHLKRVVPQSEQQPIKRTPKTIHTQKGELVKPSPKSDANK